jgi:hypothetical protein
MAMSAASSADAQPLAHGGLCLPSFVPYTIAHLTLD